MNYKYLAKENIIPLHKKIIEATGGEKGMLKFSRAGILSRGIFYCKVIISLKPQQSSHTAKFI